MSDAECHFLFGMLCTAIPGIIWVLVSYRAGYNLGIRHREERCHTRSFEDDLNDLRMMMEKYKTLNKYHIAATLRDAQLAVYWSMRELQTEELLGSIKEDAPDV